MKVVQVFRAEPSSESREGPFWIDNMIPCTTHDSPVLLPRQLRLLTHEKDLLFIITRSKNSNTIAYRRIENEVEAFWQRLDDYPDEAVTDLDALKKDLGWLERKLAYGVSTDKKTGDVSVVPVPSMRLKLVQDEQGLWKCQGVLDGRLCSLLRIYVSASDTAMLPLVHFVNIHGIDVQTGQEIVQKINN